MNADNWKIWLAFRIGEIAPSAHSQTSGRDALRSIRARFDQMGAPVNEWPAIEAAALQDQTAFGLTSQKVRWRIVEYLAGGQHPIGPLERITA